MVLTVPLVPVQRRREEIAEMEVVNNGKSITEARWDVDSARQCIEYYAGLACTLAGGYGEPPARAFESEHSSDLRAGVKRASSFCRLIYGLCS